MRFGTHLFYRTQKIKGYVNRLANLLMMGDTSDLIEGYIYELTRESFNESTRRSDCHEALAAHPRRISDYRVRRSIEAMKNKVGNTMIIEEIASESGLSRAHFFKLFKDNTGLSPNIYLNTLRVEESLRQIVNPSQTIGTISENLGFSSQASFSRFFISHVGLAPGEYRQFTAS
jgi:AraC-like DNA-binding protein